MSGSTTHAAVPAGAGGAGTGATEPRRRRPDLGPGWLPALALAGLTVLAWIGLTHYSMKLWTHNLDEDIYRHSGLYTYHNLPGALWNLHASDRGLQRLNTWTLGIPLGLFGTPTGFRVSRWIDTACYVSTVLPVWFWVRAFGVERRWAGAAAILSIVVPWATVTETFMTENLAYPLATWALYAIWRAAVRPGALALILALVAIVVASMGRSVMMLLLGVLVVAVPVTALRCHGASAWRRRRAWTLREIAPWALLALAGLIAVYVYYFDRSYMDQLTGAYRSQIGFVGSEVVHLTKRDLAKVLSGIGILPGIVAIAFIGRALWKPKGERGTQSFALALIAVETLAFIVYSSMRAGIDERYLMYLAPVLLVCAAVGLGRREVGPIGVGVAAVLVVALFSAVTWDTNQHDYTYYISASEAFHARILLLGIGSRLPDVGLSYSFMLAVGILLVAAALAFALWRRGPLGRAIGLLLLAGVVLMQVTQTAYVEKHFAAEATFGPPTLEGRTWVDGAVGDHANVGFFVSRTGADYDFADTWREVAFWNLSIKSMFYGPGAPPVATQGQAQYAVGLDDETGHLVAPPGATLPDDLLQWTITPVSPLVGRTIVSGGYEPLSLVRVARPARVAWNVTGTDPASWTVQGTPTRIRVYKGNPGAACVTVTMAAPPGFVGTRPVRVAGTTTRVAATLTSTPPLPLRGGTAGHYADLDLRVAGATKQPTGEERGVLVAGITRIACR